MSRRTILKEIVSDSSSCLGINAAQVTIVTLEEEESIDGGAFPIQVVPFWKWALFSL